jgi:hypothetical protein
VRGARASAEDTIIRIATVAMTVQVIDILCSL